MLIKRTIVELILKFIKVFNSELTRFLTLFYNEDNEKIDTIKRIELGDLNGESIGFNVRWNDRLRDYVYKSFVAC